MTHTDELPAWPWWQVDLGSPVTGFVRGVADSVLSSTGADDVPGRSPSALSGRERKSVFREGH